jgi:DNA-binding NarL/FixJ family response regulator
MAKNQPIYSVPELEKQLDRILVAIRDDKVFLLPPLDVFMLGKKSWSLSPAELAVLSLLSEYGKPVVAEELHMGIDTLENTISGIYGKLEIMNRLTIGSLN